MFKRPTSLHFYDEGAPLDDAQLDTFEQQVRVRLPAEYRAFLMEHNGGRVRPRKLRMEAGAYSTGSVQYFLSVGPPTHVEQDWADLKDPACPRMPPEHIPIAECEGGDYLTMVIDGPKRGQIFYWSHEEEGDETYTYDNLYFVAASLEDLLAGLYE